MKHLLSILLALTCATSFAQSVIVRGTGAGDVRGKATEGIYTPNATNLAITGTLTPDATGTNYVQIADILGYPAWSNSVLGFSVEYATLGEGGYIIVEDFEPFGVWTNGASVPVGSYYPYANVTGTATVAYSIITNTFPATATIRGKATP